MKDKEKQLENVEYLKYLGSLIRSDARFNRENKFRIFMATAVLNQKKTFFFYQQIWLHKFKEETIQFLDFVPNFLWSWNRDTSKIGLEIPGKFWNMALEKNEN